MKKRSFGGENGQSAIEYVLLLLVVTSVITSLFVYIKRNHLGDLTKCQQGNNKRTLLCRINNIIQPDMTGNKPLQYYPFKK